MKVRGLQQKTATACICFSLALLFETSLGANVHKMILKESLEDKKESKIKYKPIKMEDDLSDDFEENNLVGHNSNAFKTSQDTVKKDLESAPQEALRKKAKEQAKQAAKEAAESEARLYLHDADENTIQNCISPIFTHRHPKKLSSSAPGEELNISRARGMALAAGLKAAKTASMTVLKNEEEAEEVVNSLKLDKFGRENSKGFKKVQQKQDKKARKEVKTLNDLKEDETEPLIFEVTAVKKKVKKKDEVLEDGKKVFSILSSLARIGKTISSFFIK